MKSSEYKSIILNYYNTNTFIDVKMICRLRCLSLGSLLLLLLTNIWLIFRYLNSTSCEQNDNYIHKSILNYQEWMKKSRENVALQKTNLKYEIKEFDSRDEMDKAFNLSFHLGRWDKSRVFKTYDSVSVGNKFIELSGKFSVCLATQSSLEKLYSLVQVSEHWNGPISVALYAAGDEEYFLLSSFIGFLKKCFSSINTKVSFHLAVSKHKMPSGIFPEKLKILNKLKFECGMYRKMLNEYVDLRSNELVKWRTKFPYPQNHLRNLARKNCQNENVFLTDVDIVPSRNLAENLDKFLNSKEKCRTKCAYVIPTYELDYRTDFPKNKKDLMRMSKKGLARPFHHKVFIYNQYATNFTKWELFTDTSEDNIVISHNVTNFEFLYEPFYVAPDTVPEHDERFLGYGYTRNTQVYEMFVQGYEFQVLSPAFTIHWGLQGRRGRPPWRERQNAINRHQLDIFKKEVFARYQNDPLNMFSHS